MKHALPLALTASILALGGAAHAFTPAAPVVAAVPEYALDSSLYVPGADLTEPADFRSGDLLAVDLVDDASPADIAALGQKYGIAFEDNSPEVTDDGKVEVVRLSARVLGGQSYSMAQLIELLSNEKLVEAVEPVTQLNALFVPNDPKYSEQWHLKRAGAEKAWEYSCGRGVTVAVIDTGVACFDKGPFTKGTDLAGTRCVPGHNFVAKNGDAYDDHGHGTHVAGTIAQTTNNGLGVAGLAYCANLMPVKVLSKTGSGTNTDVAEGIRWAVDHGAQVINMSLGGPYPSKVIENAVKHARAKGVLIVAAAGNSGKSVGYPAAFPTVLAVSATDKNDNIAWFSSRGPQVGIGAPGVGVVQQTVCNNGRDKCEVFGVFNGTSMASPHVAGAAAMLVAQGITDVDSIKSALQSTATEKSDKNLFGAGILNADAATSKVHWSHLLFRAAALLGVLFGLRAMIGKGKGKFALPKRALAAALAFGTGLLPLAATLGLASRSGALRPVVEAVSRPVFEWPLLLDVGMYKWTLLFTAVPAVALTLLGFGSKQARPVIGGIAAGTAAFAVQMALQADASFALGSFGLRLVMAVTAVVCFFVARLTLDSKSA
ncbi:MAG: S8 family peptidase [Polyangiaceae bacterium]